MRDKLPIFPKQEISPVATTGIEITRNMEEWQYLAEKYQVRPEEIGLIDFNRSGIALPDGEVRPNFRVRFTGTINYTDDESWFALPVRRSEDTLFSARDGQLFFDDKLIGLTGPMMLDTCDTSYQRGPHLLNLNSRSRSNCAGCRACVHNDKTLYDGTVIKDQHELTTKDDLEIFFDDKQSKGLDVANLKQIAVVTGLFNDEAEIVQHMKDISETVRPRGFQGELMYFGCQVNSDGALATLAELGDFSLIYAVDNFTNRKKFLAPFKAGISLDQAKDTMGRARDNGIQTSFAYIAGVDSLEDLKSGMQLFAEASTRFPVVNIFHVQTRVQGKVMDDDAKRLEYYIKARREIEEVFRNTDMRPRRWENYRPLWYRTFADEQLDVNAFGE